MTHLQEIGSRMKKQRELQGLTREQLAEKLSGTKAFLSQSYHQRV